MKRFSRFFVYTCVIGVTITMLRIPSLEAGIQRNRKDEGVVIGKWQPSESPGGRGSFLSEGKFKSGDRLAVKIFLEHPGEEVSIKLDIKIPGKLVGIDGVLETMAQDGEKRDLSPQPSVILIELLPNEIGDLLGEVLSDKLKEFLEVHLSNEEVTYIIEIDDNSGGDPVIRWVTYLNEGPKSFGKAVSIMAKNLLSIPGTIANAILAKEREGLLPKSLPLRTLVIADTQGKNSKTLPLFEGYAITSPIWLSEDQILFVEAGYDNVSRLKTVSATLEGASEDFGGKPTEGIQPYLTPDQQSIIFLRESAIISTDLSGSQFIPLIQDKEVIHILGVFADADTKNYNLVFSTKEGGDKEIHWLAKVQGTKVSSTERISSVYQWDMLAKIRLYGKRMLYARRDKSIINEKERVWNIYLSPSFEQEGQKITTDLYNDRYPAWSLDGTKIIFVSDRLK